MTAPPFIAHLQHLARHEPVAAGTGQVMWHGLGTGPALVLLHGGHGSWLHWAANIEALAQHHTVWVPDLPGYGHSTPPPEPTLPSLLLALRESLGHLLGPTTPIALAGFSFGSLVAAHLAANPAANPAGQGIAGHGPITHLALLGAAAHGGARRPRGELLPWRAAHRAGDAAELHRLMRHNLLMHMLHGDAAADEAALHIHTQACLATRFRSREISRAGGLQALLDGYTGPTLLLWGEHDVTATPDALAPALLAGRPHCQAAVLPDAGHWVAFEAAPAVNTRLTAFFAS